MAIRLERSRFRSACAAAGNDASQASLPSALNALKAMAFSGLSNGAALVEVVVRVAVNLVDSLVASQSGTDHIGFSSNHFETRCRLR